MSDDLLAQPNVARFLERYQGDAAGVADAARDARLVLSDDQVAELARTVESLRSSGQHVGRLVD